MPRKGNRKELMFSTEEKKFLSFAMKYLGLNETAAIKCCVRLGLIQLIVEWRKHETPRLGVELEKLLRNF